MTATILSIDLIVSDPAVRGGKPVVAGTTIRVSDLAAYHLGGLAPDQLAAQFALDLAQVHAALAYYFGHREERDAEIRRSDETAARWCIAFEDGLEAQRRLRREWDERCQALWAAPPGSSR